MFFLFLLVLVVTAPVMAEKDILLPQLLNPHKIIVVGERIYIEDFPQIHIFSAQDYSLRKSFGKKGAGPSEFLARSGYVRLNVHAREDSVCVESNGRLSFFSFEGTFIKEINSTAAGYLYHPLGETKFVALRNIVEGGHLYKTVNIYDANLKVEKEVLRTKHGSQAGKKILLFDKAVHYCIGDTYIYIVNSYDFLVEVFDRQGNFVRKIHKKDYPPVKLTNEHKERTFKYLRRRLRTFPQIKSRLEFPPAFPAVRYMLYDEGKLYLVTFNRKDGLTECFILDQKGTAPEKVSLPLKEESLFREYPFDIHKGEIFQVIEDEDTEQWRLRRAGLTSRF